MKKALLFALITFSCILGASAQPVKITKPNIDQKTIDVCNKVMVNIYYDILAQKDKFKGLSQFSEESFYKNKHGIYTIVYDYVEKIQGPGDTVLTKVPFSFALTIDALKDETFDFKGRPFAYGFPPLGLKFSGYQNKRLMRRQFDLIPLLSKHGKLLNDYQQEFLPLRLYLTPTKDVYKVREDIEFEVQLVNVSKTNLLVKKLSKDTLYFTVNGRIWGVNMWGDTDGGKKLSRREQVRRRIEANRAKRKKKKPDIFKRNRPGLLKAGDSINLLMRGESFQEPQEVDIQALYSIVIKGVNPTAGLKIIIEE